MHPTTFDPAHHEPWYKYAVAILCLEMLIAIAVSAYSLYVTFHGLGGFPDGKVCHFRGEGVHRPFDPACLVIKKP